jgi:hypothetical protein
MYDKGAEEECYRLLRGKPERIILGRRCRWVDNIKMDLEEIEWGDVDWCDLAEERGKWGAFMNEVLNLRIP